MNKYNLANLSDRLLYALELTGTKKADLARAIGIQPQTINHLCHGAVQSSRFTFELATVLRLNTRWLATGEGEMFLADDPYNKLMVENKKVPIFRNEDLISIAEGAAFDKLDVIEWTILKTQESHLFCTKITDASMSPLIQAGALVFFKKINPESIPELGSIVIAYLPHLNSLMIREFIKDQDEHIFLSPLNKNLFKEIQYNDDIIIFGEATECHFKIKRRNT